MDTLRYFWVLLGTLRYFWLHPTVKSPSASNRAGWIIAFFKFKGNKGQFYYSHSLIQVLVKVVKTAMKKQNSSLKDLQIQTLISSLTAMTKLYVHNNHSMLQYVASKQKSADVVGVKRRKILAKAMVEADPFCLTRAPVRDFPVTSTGSPFGNFSLNDALDFVENAKSIFWSRYGPDMISS